MNITNESLVISNNTCSVKMAYTDQYDNIQFRIGSIFIIFILSILGASTSIISKQIKCLRKNNILLDIGKFFGSGVVLATGFIHILPAAMETLTDPCLPEYWTSYGSYSGLFAMLAILAMQLIEYVAHQQYRFCDHDKSSMAIGENQSKIQILETPEHNHGIILQIDNQNSHKISAYLLEFGISLHSILIGLALGTAATETFFVLSIALCFHQFFEGIALGGQIARFDRIPLRSVLYMVLFFAVSTPIGISLGIVLQTKAYNPKSTASLLVNGILDSLSGGILIYVALVNLITAEMGHHAHTFHLLSKKVKCLYFISLYCGAAAMAIIGRWA